ncbi:MAG: sigma-70 family RNA polymerase sigma factor, partial [Bacteroidales bacterium]
TDYNEVEEELYASELKDCIDLLIDSLPDKQKKIFLLSRKGNLTNKEIAAEMNLNIKTVEAYITKSLKYLKENIDLFAIFII